MNEKVGRALERDRLVDITTVRRAAVQARMLVVLGKKRDAQASALS